MTQLTATFTLAKLPRSSGGVRYEELMNEEAQQKILGTVYLSQQTAKALGINGAYAHSVRITVESKGD